MKATIDACMLPCGAQSIHCFAFASTRYFSIRSSNGRDGLCPPSAIRLEVAIQALRLGSRTSLIDLYCRSSKSGANRELSHLSISSNTRTAGCFPSIRCLNNKGRMYSTYLLFDERSKRSGYPIRSTRSYTDKLQTTLL